jgi:protein tyrosine/serine phosphatase
MTQRSLAPWAALVLICAPALAGPAEQPAVLSIAGVPNFHQVNETLYRGAQPSAAGFGGLARIGVKTIIDLRSNGDSRSRAEQKAVEGVGMRYIAVPLGGYSAPSDDQVAKLLALITGNASGPVFIHCRRGADRTGTIIACYRINHDHWDNQKALNEAKSFGMSWTEIAMHHYVMGYKAPAAVAATPSSAPVPTP